MQNKSLLLAKLSRWPLSLMIGMVISIIFVILAGLSFIWTPYDITLLIIAERLQTPSITHLFGTDHFGRDILSMIMIGARTSLAVALLAVTMGMMIGVPIGLIAAAHRTNILDEGLMRINDLIFAFPALIMAILITASFGPGAINAMLAIGIFNIPVFARVTRAAALTHWSKEYILAARVAGKGPARISAQHIFPNITSNLLVQGTIQFSLGILAEAGLSYVGLGAQPPMASWGRMLAESQTMISLAPHVAIFPGLTILFAVLGLNLLGDGLRDKLDPRLRPPA